MKQPTGLADLLLSLEPKDSGIVLRVPDSEKTELQNIAAKNNLSLSDFLRQAIYYYVWATSEIELKVLEVNENPEFIDLQNTSTYSIYLNNYLITDDTFDSNDVRTNKHKHSFHFGPLIFIYATGERREAILHPKEIVRVYSQNYKPPTPPPGVAIWTSLPDKSPIWNNKRERVAVFKVVRKESEDIIAGIPSRSLGGLLALIERSK